VKNSKKSIFDNFYLAGLRKSMRNTASGHAEHLFPQRPLAVRPSEVSERYRPEFRLIPHGSASHSMRIQIPDARTQSISRKSAGTLRGRSLASQTHCRRKGCHAAGCHTLFDVDNLESRKFLHSKGMNVFAKSERFWDELRAKHGRRFFAFTTLMTTCIKSLLK
jgi:hypothetical protein